jgi:hypothetical protein
MTIFTHPRFQASVSPAQDLIALTDMNRSLRDQVIALLLELEILREHIDMEEKNDRANCLRAH